MDDRTRNIGVGVTTLIGLAGLLVMLWIFGNVPGWFTTGYQLTVELPNAGGLNPGSRVRLSGIDIGQVETVRLREPVGSGVVATAQIRERVRIPENAHAVIESPLIGGTPWVELRVPETDPDQFAYLPTDDTAAVHGDAPGLGGALTQDLRDALEEPMQHLEDVSQNFQTLSDEWQLVGQHLNMLLEPRQASNESTGDDIEPNVTTILARADARLAEMEQVLAGINRYVADDDLHEDVRMTASNARQLTERVVESVDQLSASIDQNVQTLSTRYVALADDLSGAVHSMQQLADQARDGEGTMGQLVNDPTLYNNLNDTTERMQTAVDELRLLIQKWQAEGVPVQF